MILYIETAIALVFMFAVLVMFHELGHFLSARATGMRVEEFAFGFGPKLRTLFKRGDTEYTVRAFPLGGFVRIAGMEPGQEDVPDGFQAQSIIKRALVIFSGPLASLVLGVIVFIALGMFWGYEGMEFTNRVAMVEPRTEAYRVGLRAGDRITQIDGVIIGDGKQLVDIVNANPGQKIDLVINRGGEDVKASATPKWSVLYLDASWTFMKDNVGLLDRMSENSPAAKAGLKPDDRLLSINGAPITSGPDMVKAISAPGPKIAHITVKRGDRVVTADVAPSIEWVEAAGVRWVFPYRQPDIGKNSGTQFNYTDTLLSVNGRDVQTGEELIDALKMAKNGEVNLTVDRDGVKKTIIAPVNPQGGGVSFGYYVSKGLLGFQPERKLVKATMGESLQTGLRAPLMYIAALQHINPSKDIGGPLMIGKITHSATARGLYQVLFTLGALSMSLAFINLLPIPIVDGGHLVLLLVEAIRRKRLTSEQMVVFNAIGFAILAALFIAIMSGDINKLLHNSVPR